MPPLGKKLLRAIFLVLLALTLAYWFKGFYVLIFSEHGAADLFRRWTEQRYFFRGQDPSALRLSAVAHGTSVLDPSLLMIDGAAYPAWSYLPGTFFFWPSWPAVRSYYALLNLGALIFIGWGINGFWKTSGKPSASRLERALLIVSVFAIGSICTAIGTGNYPLLIAALLIGAELYSEQRPLLAGVLLGIAMLKPTLAFPFAILVLFQGRIKTLLYAGLWIALASGYAWFITGVSAWRMMGNEIQAGQDFFRQGYGFPNLLAWLGVPLPAVNSVTAAISLLVFLPFLWKFRNNQRLAFSLAAVLSRLWSYHAVYDNLILLFLLAAVGVSGFDSVFLALGASLWLPSSTTTHVAVQALQHILWLAALAVLAFPNFRPRADYAKL